MDVVPEPKMSRKPFTNERETEEILQEIFNVAPPDEAVSDQALTSMLACVARRNRRRCRERTVVVLSLAFVLTAAIIGGLCQSRDEQISQVSAAEPDSGGSFKLITTAAGGFSSQPPLLKSGQVTVTHSVAHAEITIVETPQNLTPEVEEITDASLLAMFTGTPSILIGAGQGKQRLVLAQIADARSLHSKDMRP